MPNAYVSLTTFKATSGLDIAGTQYDSRLIRLIENVSREIDRYCDRNFYFTVEARTFSGVGKGTLLLPDLIAIAGSGLKEDTNKDGTFETVWGDAGTGFLYAPYNASPTATAGHARPYTKIETNTNSNGTGGAFLRGQQNYEITGTWGYSRVTGTVSAVLSASIDATATTFVTSAAGTLSVAQSIIIDNEVMYITSTGTGTDLSVQRGMNNTTAATHTASADINELVYPGPIQEAVLIQTARLWQRRNSGFASQVGLPESGQFVVFSGGLDADVKTLLRPFMRISVG